jgi:hypothetical protein
MEIAGLPLHPLTVHATVVLVPLSALVAIVFAVVPQWRWLTRWPAALTAALALGAAWLSSTSGEALAEATPRVTEVIEEHEELGELLATSMIPFALVVALAAWSLAGPTALASGRGAQDSRIAALEKVLPAVLVLASLGVLVLVVLVGDTGARAVWG